MATPLYEGLNAQSTPEQVAAAYSQFAVGAGGDTAANQKEAAAFLQNRGIGDATINQAYQQYLNPTFESNAYQSSGPLTSDVATSLMQRSMTTGVPIYEFDRYGGYDTVQALYNAGNGSYTMSDINPYSLQNYANQVSRTGIGNLSTLAATNTPLARSGIASMLNRGYDKDTFNKHYQVYADPTRLAGKNAEYLQEQERIQRENQAKSNAKTLYTDLTGKSTPGAIAAAYAQFAEKSGGDTAKNQQEATAFLKRLGVADSDILKGYSFYKGLPTATAVADSSKFNKDTTKSLTGADLTGVGLTNKTATDEPLYKGLTAKSTAGQISDAYSQFIDKAGGNTAANRQEATKFLNKIGVDAPKIQTAYSDYLSDAPLYQSLTAQSTPQQIAEAYSQFLQKNGGENQATKAEASKYLTGIGVSDALTQDAYRSYLGDGFAGADLYKQFGVTDSSGVPTTEGILSGFRFAKDSNLSEDDLKKSLGVGTFDRYKTGLADYAKTGIANILADKKLSFEEARETVNFGRALGYDTQKLADLTGTDKKVFDAINKNYDDTTNKIVDGVLGSEDVNTDGAKIGGALALQQKYGFTDEDLAKATDFSLEQVKGFLDPVRNYEADYKKLVEDPNRSDEQTKAFLTASLQNPFLKEKLGDKLQPALDELNRSPQERILSQIEQQRNALGGQYYQGVFGDPKVMTKILADKGVKSLADLGEKDKFQAAPAQAQFTSAYGPVTQFNDGTFGAFVGSGDNGEMRMIPKDQVSATYGTYVPGNDPNDPYAFKPLSEQELATLKDGKYQQNIGTVVVNKKTGEELTDTTHELAFQSSSGGLKEKKNFLTVQFAKDGTPVLVASKQKAGAAAALQDAMPLIAMALPFVLPGIGAAISGMLPGAAVAASGATAAIAPTLINQALTQGVISGGLGTLGGGDFGKSFLSGAISPVISSGIGSLLPTGMDPNISRAITGAGTGVVKGALQGGDFGDLLGQGVLSGLTNYGLGEATKGLNLTPQQLNFATGIALPLVQGQKVSPTKLLSTLANTAR
jgi:hypothetical protein